MAQKVKPKMSTVDKNGFIERLKEGAVGSLPLPPLASLNMIPNFAAFLQGNFVWAIVWYFGVAIGLGYYWHWVMDAIHR